MIIPAKTVLSVLFLFILGACNSLPVEEVPLKTVHDVPSDAQPSPIGFNKIVFALPTGTPTISNGPKGFLEFLSCVPPYGLDPQGAMKRGRGYPAENMREIFLNTLEAQGYDVAGNPGRLFDEAEDAQRANYAIGGRIIDIKMNACQESHFFWGYSEGKRGEGHVEIEWSVFDLLHRKTVFKTVTKGYGKIKSPNFEGVELIFESALAAVIHNLGADEEFNKLIFFGEQPQNKPRSYDDPYEFSSRLYNPQEEIVLSTNEPFNTSAKSRLEQLAGSVVLLQKAGHGSGFFITKEGHILTNAHVIGNADRMRIVTSAKEEKLVAEVLRLDRKRDVALLKLENIPEDMAVRPLPVRLDKPRIGDDVYAIGTPYHTRLQDTVTKGIISAYRYDPREKQHYIQADADVHGGNSGGPLLDESGNVIGITVSQYVGADGGLSGLNNFIPIAEALEELGITVDAHSSHAPIQLTP